MQYDKLLWRMAMWIRRPPSKKQLMMWAVIAGFGLILAGMEKIRYVARHPYNGTAPEQGSTWPCKRPLGVVTCNHNELGVQTS